MITYRTAIAGVVLSVAVAFRLAAGSGHACSTAEDTQAKGQPQAAQSPRTLIGLQYESFFTPHNVNWGPPVGPSGSIGLYNGSAEAIPILGKYSSYDVNIIKKHEEWFECLGIDWLLLDWTNFLIAKTPWEEHRDATGEAEQTTELIFKTYHQLELEGKHPPKLVFMMPLFKSAATVPIGIQRMNKVIEWADKTFLDNPAYKNELLEFDGKPLMLLPWWGANVHTSGMTCADLAKITDQIPAPRWTVRWMGTQLDDSHVNQCGYWSWMDGTIRQVVTRHDGAPEETVVTPSCFPFGFTEALLKTRQGWLDPKAAGRDHGAPYLESWKVAFENRPRFIQIHQWNEFAGQPDDKGMGAGVKQKVFGDEYSLQLSDDLEPTQIHGCGFRGCGGWGYYYMNLTKALISLYRGDTPDITVLALSGPAVPALVKEPQLRLTWSSIGKRPTSYTLRLDGRVVGGKLIGAEYTLDLSKVSAGEHRLHLVAEGVHTYFDLNPERLTVQSKIPLPATSEIEFTYSPQTN
jgi:hypothetical protein